MGSTGTTIAQPNILFTADTSQLTREVQQTKAEVAQAAKAFEAGFAKGAAKAERAMTRTATSAQGIQKQFKGAGTAISGATASLQLLGQQGPPAVQTLAGAVSSLAESGFGVLGVAVAGATAAITYFASESNAAKKALAELDAAAESQGEKLETLRIEWGLLTRGILATPLLIELTKAERKLEDLRVAAMNAAGQISGFSDEEQDLLSVMRRTNDAGDSAAVKAFQAQQKVVDSLKEQIELLPKVEELRKKVAGAARGAADDAAKSASELAGAVRDLRSSLEPSGAPFGPSTGAGPSSPVTRGDILNDPSYRVAQARIAAEEEAARLRAEASMADLRRLEDQFNSGVSGRVPQTSQAELEQLTQRTEELQQELTKTEQLTGQVGTAFVDNLSGGLASAALEAESFGDALREATRAAAQLVLQLGFQSALSGLLGPGGFGIKGLQGFANGGTFTVGGFGGTDSQLVAFKATPGEQVAVSPPGRGGGMNVNIHNYGGARVATRESMGPNGPQLDVLIDQAVAKSLQRGGAAASQLERSYGLRRRGRSA